MEDNPVIGSVAWALIREETPRGRSADLDRYIRLEHRGGALPGLRPEDAAPRTTEPACQPDADEGFLRRITQAITAFF